jgi:hypothetical protein
MGKTITQVTNNGKWSITLWEAYRTRLGYYSICICVEDNIDYQMYGVATNRGEEVKVLHGKNLPKYVLTICQDMANKYYKGEVL